MTPDLFEDFRKAFNVHEARDRRGRWTSIHGTFDPNEVEPQFWDENVEGDEIKVIRVQHGPDAATVVGQNEAGPTLITNSETGETKETEDGLINSALKDFTSHESKHVSRTAEAMRRHMTEEETEARRPPPPPDYDKEHHFFLTGNTDEDKAFIAYQEKQFETIGFHPHGLGLPKVFIRDGLRDGAKGMYSPDFQQIEVDPSSGIRHPAVPTTGDGITMSHEFGHHIDYELGDKEGGNSYEISGQTASAVPGNEIYDIVRQLDKTRLGRERQREVFVESKQYASYLETPTEIWARAFSQWTQNRLTEKTGNPAPKYRIEQDTRSGQWTNDEFEAVDDMITEFLEKKGWYDG